GGNVLMNAQAQGSIIRKVEFYADGASLGSGVPVDGDKFTITWRSASEGIHALTAVATDDLGLRSTSLPVNIAVNAGGTNPAAGEFVWFDDALPTGAVKHLDGGEDWYWVEANPGSFSGKLSHQS